MIILQSSHVLQRSCNMDIAIPSVALIVNYYSISIPLVNAQQDSTNFLTYTNANLGFTIKYTPDWTVDESNIAIRNELSHIRIHRQRSNCGSYDRKPYARRSGTH
jgi:hypothetical protein